MKRAATNAAPKNLENYGIFNSIGQSPAILPTKRRLQLEQRRHYRLAAVFVRAHRRQL
jgi:hypothetical protein